MTENKLIVGANTKESIPEYLFIETGELNISDAKKILSMTANTVVNSTEALNNELRVNVSTIFKVIYENSEGVSSYSTKVDSNRSIISEGITASTKAIICANVLDCEYAGANNIKAKCTVQLAGWYIMQKSLNILQSDQTGIFTKTSLVKIENVDILPSSKLNLTYNNEARMPISKVLDFQYNAYINNVFPNNGSYQVEGEMTLKVVFLSDNKQFMCQTFSNQFTTEIMAEGITADTALDVYVAVESVEITLSSADNRGFISDIKLSLYAVASSSQQVEGVVDAYSITNKLVLAENKHTLDSLFCMRAVRDKVSVNVKVPNGVNDVECIVGALVGGSNLTNNNGLNAEGIINATVIYTNEASKLDCINVELPYYTLIAKDFDCDTNLATSVSITSINARLRTTSEIEISAEIMVSVSGKRTVEVNLVNDIEIGEEKEIDDVAISLYITKPNQTMWEVAKELNTSEAVIINQNPDLKLPIKAGDKVVLYKEINFEV